MRRAQGRRWLALVLGDRRPTERARRRDPKAVDELVRRCRAWTRDRGIVGFGLARRSTGGELTDELALKVYVERKLARSKCSAPAEPRIQLDELGLPPVSVDVDEIGAPELYSSTSAVRPLRPGISVAHPDCAPGTLGCLVRDPASGELLALSSSHVVANSGHGSAGDAVLQPATADAAPDPAERVGSLVRWMPVKHRAEAHENTAEAALFRLDAGFRAQSAIPQLGVPSGVHLALREGQEVQKVGRTTDLTLGRIRDIDFRFRMRYEVAPGSKRNVFFAFQVLCTRFAAPGDSGALVLTRTGKAAGLILGGTTSTAVFSRISFVLNELGVELAT